MKKILLQLDTDPQPSTFDAVVAADSAADILFRHGGVTPEAVAGLVHGLIFTRSPSKLHRSAIFVGGSDVVAAQKLVEAATGSFFGPLRVSVMLDANGANTTAAAAVVCAGQHLDLSQTEALVLGGTGPVGQRAARLLLRAGASVRLASRSLEKAQQVAKQLTQQVTASSFQPLAISDNASLEGALQGVQLVVAAGAAGVTLLPQRIRETAADLRVAIDLNAVPPLGIEGIDSQARAEPQGNQICYGAIGVGNTKMEIHRAALARLFEQNDSVLDAEEIYQIGLKLAGN